jgi:hypothetical protein
VGYPEKGTLPRAERRTSVRYPLRSPVVAVWRDARGKSHHVGGQALNVCEEGAAFSCLRPPPVGATVFLEIHACNLSGSARVRHANWRLWRYVVGVEFQGPPRRQL